MFGRLVKAASSSGAAAATATAVTSSVQPAALARAPNEVQARHPSSTRFAHDDWLLADVGQGCVLFAPEEVDAAAQELTQLIRGPDGPASCTSSRTPSFTSEDTRADAVIRLAEPSSEVVVSQHPPAQLERAVNMATRLLRDPDMQRRLVQCMVEDAALMQELQSNNPGMWTLLQDMHEGGAVLAVLEADVAAPTTVRMEEVADDELPSMGAPPLEDPVHFKVLFWCAQQFEAIGSGCQAMGGWLREQVERAMRARTPRFAQEQELSTATVQPYMPEFIKRAPFDTSAMHGVLAGMMKGVLVAAIAIVFMVLCRRAVRVRA